ncbi:MAG: hypothetical protein JST49_02495, partial [Bacteroidetes bacterium]|nr:hypothetical protein [Bacteroidota bacterium]
LQELFVLCHELGHLFNKDLEDKHNLTYLIPSEAEIIEENKHYQIEFNADLYAFDLLSRIAKRNYNLEKKFILSFVVTLFDIMALINPNRGGKHPAPIERIINIVQSNWGKDVAYRYLKTYDGSVTYDDFFNIL